MTAAVRFELAVLFGGTGFIGGHLSRFLLDEGIASSVIVADISQPSGPLPAGARYVYADVRKTIDGELRALRPDLVVNLAAVHREPGHRAEEYYETNVLGAERVCEFAEAVGCTNVVFTSSISVYGPSETIRDESSLPVPVTPYGGSKLVAERVHTAWQRAQKDRRLLIVRPGVIFGPGEGGNVSRLVRAVVRGYFVYAGNRHIVKAGGYVKELCNAIVWALQHLISGDTRSFTMNFTQDPAPTLEELVKAIAATVERTPPTISVPFKPLLVASHFLQLAATMVGVQQPLHPMRAHKLVRSNNIKAAVLGAYGYRPKFSLKEALADWKRSAPEEWK